MLENVLVKESPFPLPLQNSHERIKIKRNHFYSTFDNSNFFPFGVQARTSRDVSHDFQDYFR